MLIKCIFPIRRSSFVKRVKTLTCSETCKTAARFPRKTCRAFPTCVPPTFHQAGLFHSLVDRAGICEEDCRRVRDRRDWMAKQQLLLPCWPGGRGQSALRRSVLGHYQGLAGGRGVDTPCIERSLILTSSSANISDCLNSKMNLFSDDKYIIRSVCFKTLSIIHMKKVPLSV